MKPATLLTAFALGGVLSGGLWAAEPPAGATPPHIIVRRGAAGPTPEYVYDHLNPERFSANPQTPLEIYTNYPYVNTPRRAYPYGWFGARQKPRDWYYRGTRGYPMHMERWPGR